MIVLGGNGCVVRRSDDGGKTFRKILRPDRDRLPGAGRRDVLRHAAARLPAAAQRQRPAHHRRGRDASAASPRSPARRAAPAAATQRPGRRALHHARRGHRVPGRLEHRVPHDRRGRVRGRPSPTCPAGSVRRMKAVDATTFYAFGPNTLLRTTDAGQTWQAQAGATRRSPASAAPRSTCACSPPTAATACCAPRTAATPRSRSPPPPRRCSPPASRTAARAVAAGSGGATAVSDDGGRNYAPVGGDIAGSFQFGLRLGPAPNIALALGARGQLARTTDNGVTWRAINVATSSDMRDTSFSQRRRRLRARRARRPVPHRQRRRELAADRPRHDQRAAGRDHARRRRPARRPARHPARHRRRPVQRRRQPRAASTSSTAPASAIFAYGVDAIVRTTNRRPHVDATASSGHGRALARPRDDVGQRRLRARPPTAACGARRTAGAAGPSCAASAPTTGSRSRSARPPPAT